MHCTSCGAPIAPGQEFCSECGAHVSSRFDSPMVAATRGSTSQVQQYGMREAGVLPTKKRGFLIHVMVALLCTAISVILVGVLLVAIGVISVSEKRSSEVVGESQDTLASGGKSGDAQGAETRGTIIVDIKKGETEKVETQNQSNATPNNVTAQLTAQTAPAQSAPVPTSTPSLAPQTSDLLLPDSATHYYTVDELSKLSDWELYIARNEIYARRGRGFKRQNLRDYFAGCSWYVERYDPDYFDANIEPTMNDCERQNISTILDYEHYRGSPYP